jgi:hypothetical protein
MFLGRYVARNHAPTVIVVRPAAETTKTHMYPDTIVESSEFQLKKLVEKIDC